MTEVEKKIEKIIADHLNTIWETEALSDGTLFFSNDETLAGECYSELVHFHDDEKDGMFYYFIKVEDGVSFYLRQDEFRKECIKYAKKPCHKDLITFLYGKSYDDDHESKCFVNHISAILDVVSTSFKGYLLENITKLKLIPLSTNKFE